MCLVGRSRFSSHDCSWVQFIPCYNGPWAEILHSRVVSGSSDGLSSPQPRWPTSQISLADQLLRNPDGGFSCPTINPSSHGDATSQVTQACFSKTLSKRSRRPAVTSLFQPSARALFASSKHLWNLGRRPLRNTAQPEKHTIRFWRWEAG